MDSSCRVGAHVPTARIRVVLLVFAIALTLFAAGVLAAARPAAGLPSSGEQSTFATFDGYLHIDDVFKDAVRGPGGTVFACGNDSVSGTASGQEILIKYDATGAKVWSYGGRPDGATSAEGNAVAVNANGASAVAGRAWNGGNYDMTAFKVDANGNKVWWAVKAGAADSYDSALAVAIDRSGSVYVAGGLDNGASAVVVKYAAAADPAHAQTGRALWTNVIRRTGTGEAAAYYLALDASGYVYVAGSRPAANGYYNLFVRKIRPGGTTVWTRAWDGPSHRDDSPIGMVLRDGRLFVACQTTRSGHKHDFLLLRYGTDGSLKWTRSWDDSLHHDDDPWDLAVDGSGNAYVAGRTYPTATTYQGVLVKWSAAGVRRWVATYKGVVGDGGAKYRSVVVDSAGTAWVTGFLQTGSTYPMLAVRFSPAGKRQWVYTWLGPAGQGCDVWTSALAGSNLLFGAGWTRTSTNQWDALGVWIVR